MLAFGFTGSVEAQSSAPASTVGTITQTGKANAGTPEYKAIRQFMRTHGGLKSIFGSSSPKPGSAQAPMHVSVTRHVRNKADLDRIHAMDVPGGAPGAPVPMPTGNFQYGDTFSVSITSGGFVQSWTYTYFPDLGGWELTSYSVKPSGGSIRRPVKQ